MPKKVKNERAFDSKTTYHCPKCGETEFVVTRTCEVTYPLKGKLFKNLKIKSGLGTYLYPLFLEFDVDKTKDRNVNEDESRPVCSKCGFEISFDEDCQVNISSS